MGGVATEAAGADGGGDGSVCCDGYRPIVFFGILISWRFSGMLWLGGLPGIAGTDWN